MSQIFLNKRASRGEILPYASYSPSYQGSPTIPQPCSPQNNPSYVGIDTLQQQSWTMLKKNGFTFNLMVAGRSGLGKSTLVGTLMKKDMTHDRDVTIPPTTQIRTVESYVEECGVRLDLRLTDTPGFGDNVNNENCWQPIVEHIESQYDKYLKEELKIDRVNHIPDTRIHCCIYFIAPTGHSLSSLDIEVLRRLDRIVNVIPVIAKADTLSIEERETFKERIRADFKDHGIIVFPFKEFDEDEASEESKIREQLPFAVVGSLIRHDHLGRSVLGRKCKWGLVEVENKQHCEFAQLRDMVVRTHMMSLIGATSSVHYERHRRKVLKVKRDSQQHPSLVTSEATLNNHNQDDQTNI